MTSAITHHERIVSVPESEKTEPSDGNARGIAMMMLAMLAFGVADMFVKLAADLGSASASAGLIMAFLGAGSTLLFALLMRWRRERLSRAMFADRFIRLRLLGELIAATTYLTALTLIPLGEAAAIQQLHPIAMTLAAGVFLREAIGVHRWSAVIVGFVGVMLIIRPGTAAFELASLLVVVSVVGLTMRDIATRRVDLTYSTNAISIAATALLVPAGLALHLLGGGAGRITAETLPPLIGATLCSTLGFYAITASMRVGETSVVAPYRYTRILVAMLIGFLVFGERLQAATLAGAALVVGAGIYTLLRERRRGRQLHRVHGRASRSIFHR